MDIYDGNIQKGTIAAEIKKLVKESFRGHIFNKIYDRMLSLGRFEQGIAININKKKGRTGGRYGRIRFQSQRMGELALEILVGSELRGKGISVRPYADRQQRNDRRQSEHEWNGYNRRKKERRRH